MDSDKKKKERKSIEMKLGARIFKTGIAIVLALFIAELLNVPSPVFAGISAVFAVQPTIYRSYLTILEQLQGNIIGAIIAVIFVLLFGNHVIFIGLAAIIIIIINLKLNLEKTISLSLVTLIVIMQSPSEGFIEFASVRFFTIMLGVLSAFIVNLIFLPPKYEKKLFESISEVTGEILKWIRLCSRKRIDHQSLKVNVEKKKDQINKIESLYMMFKEEGPRFRKRSLANQRRLVIYRQIMSTTRAAFHILKRFYRFENEWNHVPKSFCITVQQQLDHLTNIHEQLLLRLSENIKTPIQSSEEYLQNRKLLLDLYMEYQNHNNDLDTLHLYHLMHIISAITEYSEHLEHLDILINSFQSFHKHEKKTELEETI